MPHRTGMNANAKQVAARAFVRSLNILLKFARLYGFEHTRTTEQFETAWEELREAISTDSHVGVLLGATNSELLLDGVPLATAPAERSFAQLLTAAGLASIHFTHRITHGEFGHFVRAFPSGKAKPSVLAQQLKTALEGSTGIRMNEIRFVAEDARMAEARIAAQLTASTLGADAEELKAWLNDPQKLLQLIAAAEGARSGSGSGSGGPAGNSTPENHEAGATSGGYHSAGNAEEELLGIMRLLTQLSQPVGQATGGFEPGPFQEQLARVPEKAQETLRQALAAIAAKASVERPDEPVLVQVAEHLAIRFALDRYERGEVRVNAVRQLLDRMNKEIDGLRKLLGVHEEKLTKAGILVESHADILDRQFWATVPEGGKRAVLLSEEAWCVPPRNVRQYVEELLARGDTESAQSILLNYASAVTNQDADARRRTAIGLSELAELYAQGDSRVFITAIRQVGVPLSVERDEELQTLVSAAFVRLSQEAAMRRCYPAVKQVLGSLDNVEHQRPAMAQRLRPRIGIENRVPEFIEEALRIKRIADDLSEVLRLMPRPAADQLVSRFNRCGDREDCDRLVELARGLGPEGVSHLREVLRAAPPQEAVEVVGLLSRLDAGIVEQWLPGRLNEWPRITHDRLVRVLAGGGAPESGHLLLAAFDELDPFIMPLAVDEIGMSGDRSADARLVRLAEGDLPKDTGLYLRLKAIEALGRLRTPRGGAVLRHIVEAKQVFRRAFPSELRIVAVQALEKLDPEWARDLVARSGFQDAELALPPLDPVLDSHYIRQRRYARIRLPRPVVATTTNLKESHRLEIRTASLGGGLAGTARHVAPGTEVTLKLQAGLRGIVFHGLLRDYRAQDLAFEILDIDLEARSKLRRFLAGLAGPTTLHQRQDSLPVPVETH